MRSDIVPGAAFRDYELSDHTAKRRKLSDLQGQHPMILVLSRGGFCPKDRRQVEGLVQLHRELEVGYCRLTEPAAGQRPVLAFGSCLRMHASAARCSKS
jgi:AhpC/TSA family